MKKMLLVLIALSLNVCLIVVYASQHNAQTLAVINMIEAVNEKDAGKYVQSFSDDVKVFVEGELKVSGKISLKTNRQNHFKNHPDVRSEIQHLVEIDNKVIMHDKVWLEKTDKNGRDIVEILTFTDGEISQVDVIQAKELFN